jgi:hypothetical protein
MNSFGGVWVIGCGFWIPISLILLENGRAIEHSFDYNGRMELGDQATARRDQRAPIDLALDAFDTALTA